MGKRFFQFGVRQFALLVALLGLLMGIVAPGVQQRIQRERLGYQAGKLEQATKDLRLAVQANDVEGTRNALERGADPNAFDKPMSLEVTITNGQPEILDLLLQHGADLDNKYRHAGMLSDGPAVCLAVAVNLPFETRREMVEVLVRHGASVHDVSLSRNAIDIAVVQGDAAMGDLLRQLGAPYGPREMAAFNRVDELKQAVADTPAILHQRFAPTYGHRPGQEPTLLGTALSHGHREISEWLLEHGAPLDTREGQGQTLLHLAARGGNPDLVRLLVARGLDVNARDDYEDTPLSDSISRTNLATIEALLEAGTDVNARSENRGVPTALHHAVRNGNLEFVRVLLTAGADPTIVNGEGKTALDVAADAPPEVQELLRAAMAE